MSTEFRPYPKSRQLGGSPRPAGRTAFDNPAWRAANPMTAQALDASEQIPIPTLIADAPRPDSLLAKAVSGDVPAIIQAARLSGIGLAVRDGELYWDPESCSDLLAAALDQYHDAILDHLAPDWRFRQDVAIPGRMAAARAVLASLSSAGVGVRHNGDGIVLYRLNGAQSGQRLPQELKDEVQEYGEELWILSSV